MLVIYFSIADLYFKDEIFLLEILITFVMAFNWICWICRTFLRSEKLVISYELCFWLEIFVSCYYRECFDVAKNYF